MSPQQSVLAARRAALLRNSVLRMTIQTANCARTRRNAMVLHLELRAARHCHLHAWAAPRAGCKYVASDDVDENGCKKHLCGILKCEKTCKNSPKQTCRKKCPANFCPSGQCSMRSGNCCDLKCMKEYNCNTREVWTEEKKAFCKKPCPTASCEAPKDGCKYIPSDKVDENGCKKFPCGILKCENKGECAADKDCCSSEDSCIKPRGANFKQCIGKGDKPGFLKSEVFCKCQGAKPDAVCCAANTPDCVGCSNGCTGDEFCRENPDNKVCKKKPETKCNGAPPGTKCCKESTKECVSCFKGCTADEFCAENPDSKLCSACGGKCGGQCIKEGDIAGFCQDDGKTCGISRPTCKKTKCNCKSPGTVCCNEPTAECVSCKAGCTAKEFCAENDNPDSKLCKNTKKCNGAPPGTACCKALSPSCLGCTKGCSGEEFCAENSDNKVCKEKLCPTARCEEPKDGCKYVPSDKVDEDGCKKFPCGILKCKDKCPVAVCLPPKAGCKYVASDDVDEHGCKKHLCGILKCEKTCKNSPKQTCRKKCPANFCPSGQCSMRSGNCCDLKCMKEYNCNTREV